jgi:hypothetical protein
MSSGERPLCQPVFRKSNKYSDVSDGVLIGSLGAAELVAAEFREYDEQDANFGTPFVAVLLNHIAGAAQQIREGPATERLSKANRNARRGVNGYWTLVQ